MDVIEMWNGEVLSTIVIRNKNGEVIARIDADNLTCNNKKFTVQPGDCEDVLEIQLNQKSYN